MTNQIEEGIMGQLEKLNRRNSTLELALKAVKNLLGEDESHKDAMFLIDAALANNGPTHHSFEAAPLVVERPKLKM